MLRPRFLIGALALLCSIPACHQSPSVRFRVTLDETNVDRIAVSIETAGTPDGVLTLRGFAAKEALPIVEFRAEDEHGAPLEVRAGFDTETADDRPLEVPWLAVAGARSPIVRVHYVVAAGKREGDSHLGYTGESYGCLGKDFAFLTGRNLFLLPRPAEAVGRIEVRFDLPADWRAVTPWRREGDHWRPGLPGGVPAEHLISAAIGLGRFEEGSFSVGGTRFEIAWEASLPSDEVEATVRRLEAVARYVHDLFGRSLGPTYQVVLVPRSAAGDHIKGEGWASGQGQTLIPLTTARLRDFAANLIDAYLRHAPYRTGILVPEEFWVVDGFRSWYAWQAVSRVGMVSEAEIGRQMAVRYLTASGMDGIQQNLEEIYSDAGARAAERKVLAPFMVAYLDREVRERTGGQLSLDAVVRRMFSGRTALSLWSTLAEVAGGDWEEVRSRYAQGREPIPVEKVYPMEPTRETPETPRGKAVRELTLLYTGQAEGYLENCGCKGSQSGGVARRATRVRQVRSRYRDALLLDAGSAFMRPKRQQELDSLSREEQGAYLQAMDAMRYAAAAVGTTELMFGPGQLRRNLAGVATPFLAANVRDQNGVLVPSSARIRAGGVTVGIVSVFEPPAGEEAERLLEENASSLEFQDPVEVLRQEVPRLEKDSDLVVALGRLTPGTVRRAVKAVPGLDVIISTESSAPVRQVRDGEPHWMRGDTPGFVANTLVLYTYLTSYGVHSARLGLDAGGRVVSAESEDLWLYDDVPDDPQIRGMLDRFYDRVGRQAGAQASVPVLFADDPARSGGTFIGAAACRSCHEEEYAQWRRTPHATAYRTLLDLHRHFQPRCVSCHVVGLGTESGFRIGMPEEKLDNVQCEVCHGSGARHQENPTPENIERPVPERVCLECHNPEHSDNFVYAGRLPKVLHQLPDSEGGSAPAGGTR